MLGDFQILNNYTLLARWEKEPLLQSFLRIADNDDSSEAFLMQNTVG